MGGGSVPDMWPDLNAVRQKENLLVIAILVLILGVNTAAVLIGIIAHMLGYCSNRKEPNITYRHRHTVYPPYIHHTDAANDPIGFSVASMHNTTGKKCLIFYKISKV